MHDVIEKASHDDIRTHDRVWGWFGDAVVTDVAFGYIDVEGEPVSDVDDLVRIMQIDKHGRKRSRYIYRSDIERNYTAENSMLRG